METTRRPVTVPLDSLNESLVQFYRVRGRVALEMVRREEPEDSRWRPRDFEE